MKRLEVTGAVRPMYGSLGVRRLVDHKGTRPAHVFGVERNDEA